LNHALVLSLLLSEVAFIPTGKDVATGFVVSLGDCATAKNNLGESEKGRAVHIGYRKSGKSGSQVKTTWLADCRMKAFPVTKEDTGWSYVNLEEGEGGGMLGLRTAPLKGGKEAFLAAYAYGHETVRRKLSVCLADDQLAVTCPWSKEDPWSGAPTWNFLETSDLNGDGKPEVYHRLTDNAGSWSGTGPDTWQLRILGWDAQKKQVEELRPEKEGVKVWAAVLGSFKTLKAAQQHFTDIGNRKECGAVWVWLSVLSGKEYPSVTKDTVFVGGMFTSKQDAEALLRDAAACKLSGYVKNVY
jgi:hypothetical protein